MLDPSLAGGLAFDKSLMRMCLKGKEVWIYGSKKKIQGILYNKANRLGVNDRDQTRGVFSDLSSVKKTKIFIAKCKEKMNVLIYFWIW